MDFDYGHLLTGGLIIGYGVSEFGYQNRVNALYDYISNNLFNAPTVDRFYNDSEHYNLVPYYIKTFRQFSDDENKKGVVNDPKNEFRKALYPNTVFVFGGRDMDEYAGMSLDPFDTFEFIIEQLEFGFLYTRIELFEEN